MTNTLFETLLQLYEFIVYLAQEVLKLGKDVIFWFSTPLDDYYYGDLGLFGQIVEWLIDFLPFTDVSPFTLLLTAGLPIFIIFAIVNFFSRVL